VLINQFYPDFVVPDRIERGANNPGQKPTTSRTQFERTLASATAIPEPSSLLLFGLGVLGVTRRRAPATQMEAGPAYQKRRLRLKHLAITTKPD
jgi:hypothetical protein